MYMLQLLYRDCWIFMYKLLVVCELLFVFYNSTTTTKRIFQQQIICSQSDISLLSNPFQTYMWVIYFSANHMKASGIITLPTYD